MITPVPVFRFAPSPNGFLHLGHAFSALVAHERARAAGGRFLLRIEDIDTTRAREAFIVAIEDDLAWLGLRWPRPALRQSRNRPAYEQALGRLRRMGLLYPCFCTRKALSRRGGPTDPTDPTDPKDPDGAPLYDGTCRRLDPARRRARLVAGLPHSWRLDMAQALKRLPGQGPLTFTEDGGGPAGETGLVSCAPQRWGDVILARRDIGLSYHLAVVVDDAAQAVTHVTRGRDLFYATAIHRLLQSLLGLGCPLYHHHRLISDSAGRKLAKSRASTPLRDLRAQGMTPQDIRAQLGFWLGVWYAHAGRPAAPVPIGTPSSARLSLKQRRTTMTALEIHQFLCLSSNYGLLAHDPRSGQTASIDAPDADAISRQLDEKGWRLSHILVTHHHADHTDGILPLKRRTGAVVVGSDDDARRIPGLDVGLADGAVYDFAGHRVEVLDVSGHTLGHIAFHFAGDGVLFVGDALFVLGCGRVFEGDMAQAWRALSRINALPPETVIYCGHEMALDNAEFALKVDADNPALKARVAAFREHRARGGLTAPTTLAQERETNPFLRPGDAAIRRYLAAAPGESDAAVFARLRRLKDAG